MAARRRERETDPAPTDVHVNPEGNARAARKAHVDSVLGFLRDELPALRHANPHLPIDECLASLHRRYEAESLEIFRAEEAIADA